MRGAMPPPNYNILPCIGTTYTYEVNKKAVVYITGDRKVQRNTAIVVMPCKCHYIQIL